jgi:hypothetical protein
MASYSTQFSNRYGLGFVGDFDIEETFRTMEKGEIAAITCEGYGFTHLYLDEEGNRKCGFPDFEDVVWYPYEGITDQTYKQFVQ